MTNPTFVLARRRLLAAATLSILLAACGGGTSETNAPTIQEFSADRTSYFMGETAQLRVKFSGGSGRIEPGLGTINNGALVTLPRLDRNQRLRLIVENAGQPTATREITLPVGYRDRLVPFDSFPVTYHTTTPTADGQALIIGGSRLEGVLSSAVDRFNPDTRTIQRIGQMATGRSNHSAIRLSSGQVLVFGGATSLNEAPFAELIDERSGATIRAGTLQQGRNRHAAVLLADGRVLAVGGNARNSAEIWDPTTRSWRLVAQRMAHTREYPTATLLVDGRVLIAGGDSETAQYEFAEVFDPVSERFTPVPSPAVERRGLHVAHRLSDGTLLIAGGESNVDGSLASVWRYEPNANGPGRFIAQPALTTARTLAASVLTPDDELLLFGGQVIGPGTTDSAVSYRGGNQRALPTLPSTRAFHTATRLTDGRVLIFGGDDLYGRYATRSAIFE